MDWLGETKHQNFVQNRNTLVCKHLDDESKGQIKQNDFFFGFLFKFIALVTPLDHWSRLVSKVLNFQKKKYNKP